MKRIQYHRYGGPGELRLEDVERPSPAKGEVRRYGHARCRVTGETALRPDLNMMLRNV